VHGWRYSRVGAIVASSDFLTALPLAVGLGGVVACSDAVTRSASVVFLAVAGAAVALLSVIIAAAAVIASMASDAYLTVVAHAPGGLRGLTRPFKVVAVVSAAATVLGLAVGLAWPAVEGAPAAVRWALASVTLGFGIWSLLGSVQLIEQSMFHLNARSQIVEAVRTVRSRQRNAS
jgi:hypothetical protein